MDPSPPSTAASLEPAPTPTPAPSEGLGAELRESLLLLACAVGVTLGRTTAAQAALTALS